MAKVFFGFAVADSMFSGDVVVERQTLDLDAVKYILAKNEVIPCLNPSHKPTIDAMRNKFGLDVPIPERAPQVQLDVGDGLIVMGVRGLPRLDATRHEYTQSEIDSASFSFSIWEVVD